MKCKRLTEAASLKWGATEDRTSSARAFVRTDPVTRATTRPHFTHTLYKVKFQEMKVTEGSLQTLSIRWRLLDRLSLARSSATTECRR